MTILDRCLAAIYGHRRRPPTAVEAADVGELLGLLADELEECQHEAAADLLRSWRSGDTTHSPADEHAQAWESVGIEAQP